jgi:hypothetical protein
MASTRRGFQESRTGPGGEWGAYVWSAVPGIALAAAAALGLVSESTALAIFAVSFVGLNLMHMGATWARVYVRPGWRVNPLERLAIPLCLASFAVAYEAIGGGAVLLAAQYFLSFHHALMQNYGLHRAAQRRTGRQVDPRLDLAACLMLPAAALLYRVASVCDQYSGATLPSVPLVVVLALAAGGAAALAAFAWREWQSHQRGELVDPIGCGILLGTNLMWSGILIIDSHPAIPLFAFASAHYVQYLHFVWYAEAREPAAVGNGLRETAQAWMRSSSLYYLVGLLAMGGLVTLLLTLVSAGLRESAIAWQLRPVSALAIPPWAAAMIGINLEHYWLDHRIWRRPKVAAAAA